MKRSSKRRDHVKYVDPVTGLTEYFEFCILIKSLASRARKYYTHLKSFTVPVAEEKLMPTLNILRGSAAYGRA